jgi:hypothetical protein
LERRRSRTEKNNLMPSLKPKRNSIMAKKKRVVSLATRALLSKKAKSYHKNSCSKSMTKSAIYARKYRARRIKLAGIKFVKGKTARV